MAIKLDKVRRLQQAGPAIDRGVARAAGMIRDLAADLAPVDTGALKASIRVRDVGAPGVREVVAGSDTVDYAGFVEYGTPTSAAQPYMTPASRAIDVAVEIRKEIEAL